MAQNEHHDVYDVNTIVNYDPSILAFIDLPVGSALERDDEGDLVLLEHGA
jgi:hypothetical protein